MPILADIPFELDADALARQLHADREPDDARELAAMVEQARQTGRPKALYREVFIDARGGDTVTMGGVTFTSRVLRRNLDDVHRVFAYVATCGDELDGIGIDPGDFVRGYWLDAIKAELLRAARRHLGEHLDRTHALGRTSSMNPGSGDATVWPIEQQRLLFSLLGDVEASIGVRLTDSFLMVPNKSISGLHYPTQRDFRSCQLCHREDCPSRRAPFDHALWESMQP